jgi:hypothetical protein
MSKHAKKRVTTADYRWIWLLAAAISILIVVVLLVWLLAGRGSDDPVKPTVTQPSTYPVKIDEVENVCINLSHGMRIIDVGKYSGVYMEDGTDEIVSSLMMIIVENTGTQDVQYAQIKMQIGNQTATFKMSTLPAGESIVLLEKERMAYTVGEIAWAVAEDVVLFSEPMSLLQDQIKIQPLSGAFNVTNISGKDIIGDVVIYYKNHASGHLYGGVTYRCVIKGGIKAGEVKQIYAQHYRPAVSRVMFVTCG